MSYMNEALKEAKKAYDLDEVPVGAVIIKDNQIIARAYNKKEINNDPLGHCELLAIRKACKKLNSWRLSGCQMYVTLEPCMMCLGAIIHARIDAVYYGAKDFRFGATNILGEHDFNHYPKMMYTENEKCSLILKDFFNKKRNEKN